MFNTWFHRIITGFHRFYWIYRCFFLDFNGFPRVMLFFLLVLDWVLLVLDCVSLGFTTQRGEGVGRGRNGIRLLLFRLAATADCWVPASRLATVCRRWSSVRVGSVPWPSPSTGRNAAPWRAATTPRPSRRRRPTPSTGTTLTKVTNALRTNRLSFHFWSFHFYLKKNCWNSVERSHPILISEI